MSALQCDTVQYPPNQILLTLLLLCRLAAVLLVLSVRVPAVDDTLDGVLRNDTRDASDLMLRAVAVDFFDVILLTEMLSSSALVAVASAPLLWSFVAVSSAVDCTSEVLPTNSSSDAKDLATDACDFVDLTDLTEFTDGAADACDLVDLTVATDLTDFTDGAVDACVFDDLEVATDLALDACVAIDLALLTLDADGTITGATANVSLATTGTAASHVLTLLVTRVLLVAVVLLLTRLMLMTLFLLAKLNALILLATDLTETLLGFVSMVIMSTWSSMLLSVTLSSPSSSGATSRTSSPTAWGSSAIVDMSELATSPDDAVVTTTAASLSLVAVVVRTISVSSLLPILPRISNSVDCTILMIIPLALIWVLDAAN